MASTQIKHTSIKRVPWHHIKTYKTYLRNTWDMHTSSWPSCKNIYKHIYTYRHTSQNHIITVTFIYIYYSLFCCTKHNLRRTCDDLRRLAKTSDGLAKNLWWHLTLASVLLGPWISSLSRVGCTIPLPSGAHQSRLLGIPSAFPGMFPQLLRNAKTTQLDSIFTQNLQESWVSLHGPQHLRFDPTSQLISLSWINLGIG